MEKYLEEAKFFEKALKIYNEELKCNLDFKVDNKGDFVVVQAIVDGLAIKFWFFGDVFQKVSINSAKDFVEGYLMGVKYAKYCNEN